MGKRRSNRVIWLMIAILVALVSILLLIKMQQPSQPKGIPDSYQYEIASPEEAIHGKLRHEKEKTEKAIPSYPERRIRVAIVIDDIGNNKRIFQKFVDLGIPLTFSILPGERFSSHIAAEAWRKDYEVMLHLPMEPRDSMKNPGNGVIYLSMSEEGMLQQLSRDIEAVPYIAGINNHMGSLFTENRDAMNILLKEIQKRKLYFLDSRTSSDSVAYEIAKSIGIKSGSRDVFLDNKRDVEYIKGQIDRVIKIAKKHGEAIAIGHPKSETVAALREKIPDFEREGIELVRVSEVLE